MPVHNHGPAEGRGLDCPERTTPEGLRGACMPDALVPDWYLELWAGRLAEEPCPHLSMTGDEGPVELLGRWPKRWKCDACGAVVHDD